MMSVDTVISRLAMARQTNGNVVGRSGISALEDGRG
jgi:hypothetical protein